MAGLTVTSGCWGEIDCLQEGTKVMVGRTLGGTSPGLREAGGESLGPGAGVCCTRSGIICLQGPRSPPRCPPWGYPGWRPLCVGPSLVLGMSWAFLGVCRWPIPAVPESGRGSRAHRSRHSRWRGSCHSGHLIRKIYDQENKSLEEQKASPHTLSICSRLTPTPQPQLSGNSGPNGAFNWAPDLRLWAGAAAKETAFVEREGTKIRRKTMQTRV